MRRIIAAAGQLDALSQVSLVCLCLGWFFTDTLVAHWGSLRHGVRFFQMSALLHDPSMMFFEIPLGPSVLLFALLCAGCIVAPLLPRLTGRPGLAVANFAPLLLLLVCAVLLYQRTAGDFLPPPSRPEGVAGRVVGLANRLLNKGSTVVAHHVAVGLGGYLAALAGLALAVQGVRQLQGARRRAPADAAPIA